MENAVLYQPLSETKGSGAHARNSYDWVFLYWMPYDNDLSYLSAEIFEQLAQGVRARNLAVAVQADLHDGKPMSRTVLSGGTVETSQLADTDSGSPLALDDFLRWAREQFDAQHWAVAFLGHGGCLDQISPDVDPGRACSHDITWLNLDDVSNLLSKFNQAIENRLELVFLQNCCKGTIEAHYTLRNTAPYTLSSQTDLGAPNYYYTPLLQYVAEHPHLDGGDLAEKIMEFDRCDMYDAYTVTSNIAVRQLPNMLNPLIEAILAANVSAVRLDELQVYQYVEDRLADVLQFFRWLVGRSGGGQQELADFERFFRCSMVRTFRQSPATLFPDFGGLSVYVPSSRHALQRYRYLPIFRDIRLAPLFEAILPV